MSPRPRAPVVRPEGWELVLEDDDVVGRSRHLGRKPPGTVGQSGQKSAGGSMVRSWRWVAVITHCSRKGCQRSSDTSVPLLGRTSSRSMSLGRCPRVMPPQLFTRARGLRPLRSAPLPPEHLPRFRPLRPRDGWNSRWNQDDDQSLAQAPWTRPRREPETHQFAFDFRDQHGVFVLPMSSPTRYLFFLRQAAAPAMNLFCSCGGRARTGVGIHDHLPRILQIDRLHAAAFACHCEKLSTSILYLPVNSLEPK